VHGLCSNYLCDCKPGDELVMTGPAGTALLLNDNPWNKRIVCVSTGELACRKTAGSVTVVP
jgi:ferredoxin-NADP reductase